MMALDKILPRGGLAIAQFAEGDETDGSGWISERTPDIGWRVFERSAGVSHSVTLWDEVSPEIQRSTPDRDDDSPDA
ncbi:hypothetical protein BurMR1_3743 [Burkholderia sp. MR1]|nr:hypothetical protein BurMR1_3743 [Burkholderia sp. MR1]